MLYNVSSNNDLTVRGLPVSPEEEKEGYDGNRRICRKEAGVMPLPLTVSCFTKIEIGFTFLVPAHLGSPGKRAVKRVCVCVRLE